MAQTIKGIKTADGVVHKIDGAAMSFGKACLWNADTIRYAVPLILGRDYAEVPVGSTLRFYYYDSDSQKLIEQTLKAHKETDASTTLYFSPDFSDDDLYTTYSDLDSVDSFCISFSYSSSASNGYIYTMDNHTSSTVGLMVDALTAALAYELAGSHLYIKVKDTSEATEEALITDSSDWSTPGISGCS